MEPQDAQNLLQPTKATVCLRFVYVFGDKRDYVVQNKKVMTHHSDFDSEHITIIYSLYTHLGPKRWRISSPACSLLQLYGSNGLRATLATFGLHWKFNKLIYSYQKSNIAYKQVTSIIGWCSTANY